MPNTPFRQAQTVHAARRKTRAERRKHFFRDILKGVEQLEDRSLLASVVWDGGALTLNWNDADNWEPNAVPTAADDVTIGDQASPIIVTGATAAARSISSAEQLQVLGSLSIGEGGTLSGGLDLSGGTLSTGGLLTVSSNSSWSGGTLTGTGTFANSGHLSLSGNPAKALTGTLTFQNSGTVAHSGLGFLTLTSGNLIRNLSTGLFHIQTTTNLDWVSGTVAPQFVNEGVLRKSGGSTISRLDFILDNAGTVEVVGGLLGFGAPHRSRGAGRTSAFGCDAHRWNVDCRSGWRIRPHGRQYHRH